MKIINIFGGPGCGKSSTAAGLFYLMKRSNYNVELVTEYAKDLTWEGDDSKLQDQLYILAKQNRRLVRLENKVDYIITDSPLLLGIQYATPDYYPKYYESFLLEVWRHYDNLNYLLTRDGPYVTIGRSQSEKEAVILDAKIRNMLVCQDIPFMTVKSDPQVIFDAIGLVETNPN
tara:strand:- start:7526 stop:8047 length:522 start_codon:yes stop_codon:yes gene_type:complete